MNFCPKSIKPSWIPLSFEPEKQVYISSLWSCNVRLIWVRLEYEGWKKVDSYIMGSIHMVLHRNIHRLHQGPWHLNRFREDILEMLRNMLKPFKVLKGRGPRANMVANVAGVSRGWETLMVLNTQDKMKPKWPHTSSEGDIGDIRHETRRVSDEHDTDPERVREIPVCDKHKNKNFIENGKCYGYLKVDVEYGCTPAERDVILLLTESSLQLMENLSHH